MVKIFNLDFYDENLENLKIELEKDIDENKKVRVYTPNVDHIINIKSNENVFSKYLTASFIDFSISTFEALVTFVSSVTKPLNIVNSHFISIDS